MKFKSALVTQATGSIGGMTASHNRGGLYLRARAIPTQPNSPEQQAVKAWMAQISARWVNVLTQAQRDAWAVYSNQVQLIDKLGEPRNIGGVAMYNRTNIPRLQAGLALIDDAPLTFNLGTFTPPTIDEISDPSSMIAFTNTDAWASTDGGACFVLISRPQNPSIGFFKGPFRFAGVIAGAATPPTSPATITNPFTYTAGQKGFIQVRIQQPDGRTALPIILSDIAV